MKKIITIVFISVLCLSTLPIKANANVLADDVDHFYFAENYDGYFETMAQTSIVKNSYIMAKYTNNREWIDTKVSAIKQNVSDLITIADTHPDNLMDSFEKWFGMLAIVPQSVIDFFKSFFEKEKEVDNEFVNEFFDYYTKDFRALTLKNDYVMSFDYTHWNYTEWVTSSKTDIRTVEFSVSNSTHWFGIKPHGDSKQLPIPVDSAATNYFDTYINTKEDAVALLMKNYNVVIKNKETNQVQDVTKYPPNVNNIVNYINNDFKRGHSSSPTPVTQLVCPSFSSYLMLEGQNMLLDGQVIKPNKDLTVVHDNENCNIVFTVPEIDFVGDKAVVNNPSTNELIDIETSEKVDGEGNVIKPEYNGNPDNCDGVLCFLGTIIKSISSMVSTVVDAITGLIDMLFHLIVPENLDFISDLFDSLKTTFTEKFAIATDLQNLFKSIFTESTTNPLSDLSFTLPATETQLSFSVFSVVDNYVPMIKRIISALLGLMTLMYVYRKITGSGGVMEK